MVRPRRRRALLPALLAALAPATAAALPPATATGAAPAARAETPLAARRVLVEVGCRASAFHYAEYGVGGAFLDGEDGILLGLEGAVELRAGPVALRAAASTAGAELGYVGRVQSGSVQLNDLPVSSTSGAHLFAAGAELAVLLPRGRGVAVLGGAGRRRWDRSIHDTTVVSRAGAPVAVRGLAETYRWDELAAGLRVPLLSTPGIVWDADGRVVRSWRPSMTVAWTSGAVRLPLRARTGWALATALRVAVGPTAVARLGFSLERREFGESDVDRRTGLWEPASITRTTTLELGVGTRF